MATMAGNANDLINDAAVFPNAIAELAATQQVSLVCSQASTIVSFFSSIFRQQRRHDKQRIISFPRL